MVRTVTVTGSASSEVRPDRATLSLGVQARRPSAQSAMAVADDRAATLVDALRDAGATDADLRTTGLNLWFDQSERSYVASYSMNVSARPTTSAGSSTAAPRSPATNSCSTACHSRSEPAAASPRSASSPSPTPAPRPTLATAADARSARSSAIVEGGGVGAIPVFKGATAGHGRDADRARHRDRVARRDRTYELLATD